MLGPRIVPGRLGPAHRLQLRTPRPRSDGEGGTTSGNAGTGTSSSEGTAGGSDGSGRGTASGTGGKPHAPQFDGVLAPLIDWGPQNLVAYASHAYVVVVDVGVRDVSLAERDGAQQEGDSDKKEDERPAPFVGSRAPRVVQTLDEHRAAISCVRWAREALVIHVASSETDKDSVFGSVLRLVTGDRLGNILIWDVLEGSVVGTLRPSDFSSSSSSADSAEMSYEPDGRGVSDINDITTGAAPTTATGAVVRLEWHPHAPNRLLLALYEPGVLMLWDISRLSRVWCLDWAALHRQRSAATPLVHMSINPFFLFSGTEGGVGSSAGSDPSVNNGPSINLAAVEGTEPALALASSDGGVYFVANLPPDRQPSAPLFKYRITTQQQSRGSSSDRSNFVQLVHCPCFRGVLYFVLKREVLIVDSTLNQSVGSIVLDRRWSNFVKLMPSRQDANVIYSCHEDGSVACWARDTNGALLEHRTHLQASETQTLDVNSPLSERSENQLFHFDAECTSEVTRSARVHRKRGVITAGAAQGEGIAAERQLATLSSDGALWLWEHVPQQQVGNRKRKPRMVLTGTRELISNPISSLAVRNRIGEDPSEPAFVAIGTHAGTLIVLDATQNVVTFETQLFPPGEAVRGVRWVSGDLLLAYCCTELKQEVYQNRLCSVDVRSGVTKDIRRMRSTVAAAGGASGASGVASAVGVAAAMALGSSEQSGLAVSMSTASSAATIGRNTQVTGDGNGSAGTVETTFIRGMRLSPLAQYFVLLLKDAPFELWDARSMVLLRTMRSYTSITALEWAPEATKGEGSNASASERFVFTEPDGSVRSVVVRGGAAIEQQFKADLGIGVIYALAWQGPYLVSGDSVGTITIWDTVSHRVHGTFPNSSKGLVRRLRFAPHSHHDTGGAVLVLALFNNGDFGVWDVRRGHRVAASNYLRGRDLRAVDCDWISSTPSDTPVVATNDGCVRLLDRSLALTDSPLSIARIEQLRPLHTPHLLRPKDKLRLRVLLHHVSDVSRDLSEKVDRGEALAVECGDGSTIEVSLCWLAAHGAVEHPSSPVASEDARWLLSFVPFHVLQRITATLFTNQKALLVAEYFGCVPEAEFWQSVGIALKAGSAPTADADDEGPFETPGRSHFLDVLLQGPVFQSIAAARASAAASAVIDAASTPAAEQTATAAATHARLAAQAATWHLILGNKKAAVQTLLEQALTRVAASTETDTFESTGKRGRANSRVQPSAHLAGVSATMDWSQALTAAIIAAGSGDDALFHSTIKLISSQQVASGDLGAGVRLLCAIGKHADACKMLQAHDAWPQAASIARAALTPHECRAVFRRWASHLNSQAEAHSPGGSDDSSVRSRQDAPLRLAAVGVLLSIGEFTDAIRLLIDARLLDMAALLSMTLTERGIVVQDSSDGEHQHRQLTALHTSSRPQSFSGLRNSTEVDGSSAGSSAATSAVPTPPPPGECLLQSVYSDYAYSLFGLGPMLRPAAEYFWKLGGKHSDHVHGQPPPSFSTLRVALEQEAEETSGSAPVSRGLATVGEVPSEMSTSLG
jgi:WD40 repeat protein